MRLLLISLSVAFASAAMAASHHTDHGNKPVTAQSKSTAERYTGQHGSTATPRGPQKLKCEMEKCSDK
jgi:hypothetical protein